MLPPGLLLAWLLARGQFRGRVLLDTLVSLPLVMPPVATGSAAADAVRAARPDRARAGARGNRGRVHLEGGRARDGGHGAAALRAHRPRRLRAGRSPLRSGRPRRSARGPLRVFFTVSLPLARRRRDRRRRARLRPGASASSAPPIMIAGSIPDRRARWRWRSTRSPKPATIARRRRCWPCRRRLRLWRLAVEPATPRAAACARDCARVHAAAGRVHARRSTCVLRAA